VQAQSIPAQPLIVLVGGLTESITATPAFPGDS